MGRLSSPRHRLAGFAFLLALGVGLVMTVPALADYLGPDRHVVEMVEVRAPANDYWTCGNRNPPPGVNGTCILQNPTNPCPDAGGYHPSKEQQQGWCQWWDNYEDYTGCGCTPAYTYQTIEYDLPEATISGDLQGCVLSNGWCVSSPGLHLAGAEPLAGYEILVLEGTRNGEPFACAGALCDVPLLEGENGFAFWALSSYGDSSQMGGLSARVDTVGPSTAFISPPEGSTAWASGVVELSGISADLTSGLAAAEISMDSGGSWAPVGLDGGGAWSQAWETWPEADGSRPVLARAWDQAGNLGPVAQCVLLLDNTPPAVDLPDRWEMSEAIGLTAADAGSGVDRLEVTIQGGGLGVRQYTYTAETVPGSWTWDGTFGGGPAPSGEYAVMLAAWDLVGNRGEDTGVLVIPAPAAPAPVSPEATRAWVSAPPPASPPPATEPPVSGTILLAVTPVRPAPTDVPAPEAALPQETIPEAPQPSVAAVTAAGNGNGVLWGAAALALIAGVTAYVLSLGEERRRRAAEELAAKQRQAAEWAAQAARLRARVEANYQAIQAYAIAMAAAAAEAVRRARDEWFERREQRWEEEEIARQEAAEEEARRQREAEAETRRLAAATAQMERLREIAEGREEGAEPSPRLCQDETIDGLDALQFVDENRDTASMAVRGVRVSQLLGAAGEVRVSEVGSTLRVFGPRASRDTLGLREMVNWVRSENRGLIAQDIADRAIGSLRSWGLVFGMGFSLASDTLDYVNGESDRQEYAAALTIDTGFTIGSALLAGATAGAATGALVGVLAANITLPIVGTVPGVVLGGLAGAAIGMVSSFVLSGAFEATGTRRLLIDRVADLYGSWIGAQP